MEDTIKNEIIKTGLEMKKHYKGGIIQTGLFSDLFKYLEPYNLEFVKKTKKELKTQIKSTEVYMVKDYGIKFELVTNYKLNPFRVVDHKIKLITK